MQVYAVQHDIVHGDKDATHEHVRQVLQQVDIAPQSLIVLPEMFATGWTRELATLHDETGQSRKFLIQLAQQYQSFICAGIVLNAADGRGRNLCVVYDPQGQLISRYQKIHPFTYSGEAELFQPGETVQTYACNGITICPVVCYDLRFPELFRMGVQQGAQLFTVIASWPAKRTEHWLALLRARAIENQAYIIGVNRCGEDPHSSFHGRSQIIDPYGEILVDAGDRPNVIHAELQMDRLNQYRRDFPALADIRFHYTG